MTTDNDKSRERSEAVAAGEKPLSRYAILVVVEATGPEAAWDAVQGTAGALEGDGEPDCMYVGAPWRGVPASAEDPAPRASASACRFPTGLAASSMQPGSCAHASERLRGQA